MHSDNNLGTRWSSAFPPDPQWISVDLGVPRDIDSVILYWEGAYVKWNTSFKTSTDNVTWTDQYHEFTGNGGTDKIYFTATGVQYVRMFGLQRGTPYGFSLWEFEVYSTPQYAWSPNDGSISDIASASPNLYASDPPTTYTLTIPDPCLGETTLNFTIVVDCNPLPIELLSFNGFLDDREVDLYWITESEINNDYFIVQRSENASNWTNTGQVDGAGNHVGQLTLRLHRRKFKTGQFLVITTRLRQVDFNGASSLSQCDLHSTNEGIR